MNRRHFIAAASASSAALTSGLRASSASARPRIPIGFLGVTYSHGPAKLELALKSPDWDFVGVCDPSPAARGICERLGARMVTQTNSQSGDFSASSSFAGPCE